MNSVKEINNKNRNPKTIKIDENSHKNILTYYIGYVTKQHKLCSLLYIIINKVNRYIDEHNRNKYLTLVHTDKGKDAPKKHGELWKKVKDLTR